MKIPALLLLSLLILPVPVAAQSFAIPPDAPKQPASDDTLMRQLLPPDIYERRKQEREKVESMSPEERERYKMEKVYEPPVPVIPTIGDAPAAPEKPKVKRRVRQKRVRDVPAGEY